MSVKPLAGIRVADFGQVVAGPMVGHLLADFGAEVIRVESRASTDYVRIAAMEKAEIREILESTFQYRNRWCVTINFSAPEGADLARKLIGRCDAMIENFSPKVLRRFGLDYESLRKIKPDLVMLSMSAAGQTGPLQNLIGYGPAINAVAGTDSLIGYYGENRPMVNFWEADYFMGVTGTFAVLTALHHRANTGEGQHIDMGYYETLASLNGEGLMDYVMNGRIGTPQGNRHPDMAPHGTYPCAGDDRWISIAVQTEAEWQGLCRAIGHPLWTKEARFADPNSRLQHREELDDLLGKWTVSHDCYDLMYQLQAAGVAATPVMSIQDIYMDPHEKFRRTSVDLEVEGVERENTLYGIPWHLKKTPGSIRKLSRKMGQDNDYVFREIVGLSSDEVDKLTREEVIY